MTDNLEDPETLAGRLCVYLFQFVLGNKRYPNDDELVLDFEVDAPTSLTAARFEALRLGWVSLPLHSGGPNPTQVTVLTRDGLRAVGRRAEDAECWRLLERVASAREYIVRRLRQERRVVEVTAPQVAEELGSDAREASLLLSLLGARPVPPHKIELDSARVYFERLTGFDPYTGLVDYIQIRPGFVREPFSSGPDDEFGHLRWEMPQPSPSSPPRSNDVPQEAQEDDDTPSSNPAGSTKPADDGPPVPAGTTVPNADGPAYARLLANFRDPPQAPSQPTWTADLAPLYALAIERRDIEMRKGEFKAGLHRAHGAKDVAEQMREIREHLRVKYRIEWTGKGFPERMADPEE